MPLALLLLGAAALAAAANARRPLRAVPVVLPSFFTAWLTAELAPHLLVGLVVLGAALVAAGALQAVTGLVGLALLVGALALLAGTAREAWATGAAADAVLADLPGAAPAPDPVARPGRVGRWFVPLRLGHPDVVRVRDVSYADRHPRLRLDVYHRRDRPSGAPTLLQVHGGAWVIGRKEEQGRPLMLRLARAGWVCVAPNYRLSPRATWPDHLVDVKEAIAWVRAHAADYGADPGFLVLTGGSAGAHLASLAALTPGDPRYQPGFEDADTSVSACVPFYGVYDVAAESGTRDALAREKRLLAPMVFKTSRRSDPDVYRDASPLAQVHAGAPPFLVVHGRNDTLVPVEEARLFVDRLRTVSHAPVLYLELPGTQHAFDVFPSVRGEHVMAAVERFVTALHRDYLAERQG